MSDIKRRPFGTYHFKLRQKRCCDMIVAGSKMTSRENQSFTGTVHGDHHFSNGAREAKANAKHVCKLNCLWVGMRDTS